MISATRLSACAAKPDVRNSSVPKATILGQVLTIIGASPAHRKLGYRRTHYDYYPTIYCSEECISGLRLMVYGWSICFDTGRIANRLHRTTPLNGGPGPKGGSTCLIGRAT